MDEPLAAYKYQGDEVMKANQMAQPETIGIGWLQLGS
jgi:hypothetical protein